MLEEGKRGEETRRNTGQEKKKFFNNSLVKDLRIRATFSWSNLFLIGVQMGCDSVQTWPQYWPSDGGSQASSSVAFSVWRHTSAARSGARCHTCPGVFAAIELLSYKPMRFLRCPRPAVFYCLGMLHYVTALNLSWRSLVAWWLSCDVTDSHNPLLCLGLFTLEHPSV